MRLSGSENNGSTYKKYLQPIGCQRLSEAVTAVLGNWRGAKRVFGEMHVWRPVCEVCGGSLPVFRLASQGLSAPKKRIVLLLYVKRSYGRFLVRGGRPGRGPMRKKNREGPPSSAPAWLNACPVCVGLQRGRSFGWLVGLPRAGIGHARALT